MTTWIRTYTKSHLSFSSAASDREGVVSSLAREIGSRNVKARIRKRSSGRFDVLVSRREPLLASDVAAFEKVSPPTKSSRSSTLRTRSVAVMALAIMAGGN
jgi:hypothetical protein